MDFELTEEEEKAIRALKRLEKIWPGTLWLYSTSGSLNVMKSGENGEQVHTPGSNGGVDPEYMITTIGINNDGGDW